MTVRALIVGATGGIGSACVRHLNQQGYQTLGLGSADIDLNHPESIFDLDLATFDLLMNCAGHSQGSYLGFLGNSWRNQLSQLNVNYVSNLMLLRHYADSRSTGRFVWFNSTLADSPRPFHSIYASTKAGSKFAIDLMRQEVTHISILEVKIGLTRTGFRFRNFQGSQSMDQVNSSYDQDQALDPDHVARLAVQSIMQGESFLTVK